MLKIAILCAFIAFSSAASPSWLGQWYVMSSEGSSVCNMPSNVTYPLISMYLGTIAIYGNTANGIPGRWDMNGWTDPNAQDQASCSGTQCTTGHLTTVNGIEYANLTWNSTTGPEVWCNIVLTPANVTWNGTWLVLNSGSNDLSNCDVPKKDVFVNITEQSGLILRGADQLTGGVVQWLLNWQINQVTPSNICDQYFCLDGQLSIVGGVLHGEITWNKTGTNYYCRTQFYRLITDELDYYGDDLAIISEDSPKFLDIIY